MNKTLESAIFGGGCFWCTEAVFSELAGVISVVAGYSGGITPDPDYKKVSTGKTGHAEVVKIYFDPQKISYRDLLSVFFATHDPTSLNRQGADVGTQYRSVIFYNNDEQRLRALEIINELNSSDTSRPFVTEVVAAGKFYPAEQEHDRYYEKNKTAPYCRIVIDPKLHKVRERYAALLKTGKKEEQS